MSGRYNDYKGSSRSTRDDSRLHRDNFESKRSRSRSRSPRRRNSPRKYSKSPPHAKYERKESSRHEHEDKRVSKSNKRSSDRDSSEEEVPAPPPPPRITKISIGFSNNKAPIKMSIGGPAKPAPRKPTVASVFNNDDDDDEPEEMPAEARMRMRNIGRETPTSAGPNSFGKTKQGFCDAKKVFEKNLKHALETTDKPKPSTTKFPQTIYKLGP